MSHVVNIRTEIRDSQALRAACHRLGLTEPAHETVRLFSAEATGYAVRLPDWRYPVVCQLETGTLAYDNFQGRWGNEIELGRLRQSYAIEKARIESHKQGHQITETNLVDGSVKLTIQIGGAA